MSRRTSTRPLFVQNVFICSRMAFERERNAAHHAISSSGLTPFMFERQPGDRHSRVIMQAMIDASDYFLGIYDGDAGVAAKDLSMLRPIEYEFWRFLLGMEIKPDPFGLLSLDQSQEIEGRLKAIGERGRGSSTVQAFIRQSLDGGGSFYTLCEDRVRILRPKGTRLDEGPDFLTFLPEKCWVDFEPVPGLRYSAAHQEVFRLVRRRLQMRLDRGELAIWRPGIFIDGTEVGSASEDEYALFVAADFENREGVLEAILLAFFQTGLNLRILDARPLKRRPGSVRFRVVATPFREAYNDIGAVKRIRSALVRNLNESLLALDAGGPVRHSHSKLVRLGGAEKKFTTPTDVHVAEREDSDDIVIRIPFVDTPGALWEIVSRISRPFEGSSAAATGRLNITKVEFVDGSDHKTIRVSVESEPWCTRELLDNMAYQLHSANCVQGPTIVHGPKPRCADSLGVKEIPPFQAAPPQLDER